MAYFTYDTSVLISRKLTDFHEMPQRFLMSAVVQMELIAGAEDQSRRKFYERAFRQYRKDNSLIVPNDDEWRPTFSEASCHKRHKMKLVIRQDLVWLEAHLSEALAGLVDHFA